MPTYDWFCKKCESSLSEIRSISSYEENSSIKCTKCGNKCGKDSRDYSKAKLTFSGTSVQSAEFNPGLGCVVKNKQHRSELLKQKGLVEVGNDFGSGQKMQDEFKKKKDQEREERWKDPNDFFLN